MSRRKILLTGFLVVASVINLFMIPTGFAQPKFTLNSDIYLAIPQSHSVNISIDRGQDSTYFIDDPIIIRYGATKTGYINIFDYTPGGSVLLLVRNQEIIAGSNLILNSKVKGPTGIDRLIILFTPKPVGENELKIFIESPHQSNRYFPLSAVNRIHFKVADRNPRAPNITLEPSQFIIEPGSCYSITAQLNYHNGQPVQNSPVDWSTDYGTLNTKSNLTDNNGKATVTYQAPESNQIKTAVITAFSPGHAGIPPISVKAVVNIVCRTHSTEIIVCPSSFSTQSGDKIQFTATLQDISGNPICDRTLYWSSNVGDLNESSAITNLSGQVTFSFYTPEVNEGTSVNLTVEFRGAEGLCPSKITLLGNIKPVSSTNP
ncbi:MAG TPA: Ig-like domain-containing protein [Atribacter sp.]|jgi:hypothetical protein|uniref:Ig-like domain-containing protein n=1 Tax=Atribacter sp. TaxID=2847780 RepID=UPI0017598C38|nr:Ig-like domain-containing protein [Atribacter sp.]HHT10370.1 hypothetical protein [Candidatus Atribacteria bacterium]HQK84090.1 Ig-like domain-containing protein [Atribacter sp.]